MEPVRVNTRADAEAKPRVMKAGEYGSSGAIPQGLQSVEVQ
jgi:hypothetical protein